MAMIYMAIAAIIFKTNFFSTFYINYCSNFKW